MTEVLTHRPAGSGHPYRIDADQRHPVQLVGGDPFELRVLAPADVVEVVCERADGGRSTMTAATADELYGPAGSTSEGHLAAASGARPDLGSRRPWRVTMPAPEVGVVRYRFLATASAGAITATEWFQAPVARWSPDGGRLDVAGSGPAAGRVVDGSTEWLVTDSGPVRVRFALELADGEHVVGFGERFDALDQRGRALDTVVFEQYKQQGPRTYLPSPFAIVPGADRGGWGFHVRTSRRVWFDVGQRSADRIWIEVGVDAGDPVVELRCYDGAPAEVLAAHVAETGGLRRPPDWVFRPWMSANNWNSQARVLGEVERSVALGVPVGAVVIEAWSDEATFTVFRDAQYTVQPDGGPLTLGDLTFPQDGAWPEPVRMVERLHALGVRVLLWQIPLVPTDRSDPRRRDNGQVEADAATMIERQLCVAEADGSPYRNRGWWFPGALLPDWTNPETVAWWLAKRRYLLDEVGIDGFKTDGGEHAWGDDLRYSNGSCGASENNRFAQRFAEAYTSLFDERAADGVDGVTFSRAGFTGAGRTPCHWAGDEDSTWEAFRASITAGLTAGASGVAFWGWDLAGFSGEIPSVELYVRAAAMAALCPIMQYHSEYDDRAGSGMDEDDCRDRTPWNIARRHGDERALSLYRRFAILRERLGPYLAEQADRSVATGLPMMRALCFGFPDDPAVWSFPRQYQFGDALLVAPICHEGRNAIDVYLPVGEWVDAWSGTRHVGPQTVTRDVPLAEIAVYIDASRAGELLPVFRGLSAGASPTDVGDS